MDWFTRLLWESVVVTALIVLAIIVLVPHVGDRIAGIGGALVWGVYFWGRVSRVIGRH